MSKLGQGARTRRIQEQISLKVGKSINEKRKKEIQEKRNAQLNLAKKI
jgi:hypothetical protein